MNETEDDVRGPMPRWLRAVGWLVGVAAAVCLAAFGGLALTVVRAERALPPLSAMKTVPKGRTVRILAADGSVLQTLGPAYGEWLPARRIPDVMMKAVVAIEDRRFYSHPGVDPRALVRVAWFAWRHKDGDRRLQGASTITQQVARTIFLSRRYAVSRKLREMAIALALEQRFDKATIGEIYLNRIYLGGGAWGIDAASRRFFGHPATTLTLSEATLLAGLAKAPSDYAPSQDPSAAFARQRDVLKAMVETGAVTAAAAAQAARRHPSFAPPVVAREDGTAYFTDYLRPQIDALAPEGAGGDVVVRTTLQPRLQSDATTAVVDGAPKGAQGALLSVDADGAILAMVGGLDHAASPFNRAVQATRQPGSSFKLFVYLAALESGMVPGSGVLDAPITIGDWSPRNSTAGYVGQTSLANAFAQSINTVAARLGRSVGTRTIADAARRLGFTTPISLDPAMVLGSSEARLIDMTRAYATVADGGVLVAPYGISSMTVDGRTVFKHRRDARLALTPSIDRQMVAMLQNNVRTGTGAAAAIGRPAGGKTGTTTSGRDGWFMGFSSGITTGVWVGRDDAQPIDGLQGGRAPARIFSAFMTKAVEGRPVDAVVPLPSGGGSARAGRAVQAPARATTTVDEDGEPIEAVDAPSPPARPVPPPRAVDGPAPRSAPVQARSRAVPMDAGTQE